MKLLTTLLLVFVPAINCAAQAFCSLRNPNIHIHKFFPQNTGYRTIVGSINDKVTDHVSKITGLRLHKNEVGRHNLYIVKKQNSCLGIVHSRSDLSQWGLIETVWSLNLNLTVADYDFQRFRSSLKSEFLSSKIKSQIIGKNFYELKKLYIKSLKEDQTKDINSLFTTLISAALKSIAVTENCWTDTLNSLKMEYLTSLDNDKIFGVSASSTEQIKISPSIKTELHKLFIIHDEKGRKSILFSPLLKLELKEYENIKARLYGELK